MRFKSKSLKEKPNTNLIRQKAAFVFAAAACCWVLNCDEKPLGPGLAPWTRISYLPENCVSVNGVAVRGGTIYITAQAEDDPRELRHAVIYSVTGATVRESFRAGVNGYLQGICSGPNSIWAVGYKRPSGGSAEPYIITGSGAKWSEIPFPSRFSESALSGVTPYGRGRFIVYGRDVFLFDQGMWSLLLSTASSRSALNVETAVTGNGSLYVLPPDDSTRLETKIYASGNGGAAWNEERVMIAPAYSFHGDYFRISPAGDDVFIITAVDIPEPKEYAIRDYYTAVIRRPAAPAGAGDYELSFIAPEGPNFLTLSAAAFKDARNGYAVGDGTSVRLEDGVWRQEEFATPPGPAFTAIAYAEGRYFAVGLDHSNERFALYTATAAER